MNMFSIHATETRLLKDLASCFETAEVYDAGGKLLGVFVPVNLDRMKEKYAQLLALVDRDRASRQDADPRACVPHGEVVARLKALNQESERRKSAREKPFTREEANAFMRAGFPGGITTSNPPTGSQ
jgi:hypothetical protein